MFKVAFEYMDIVNVIENYINTINVYDFQAKSEEMLSKEGMLKKFLHILKN